MAGFPGIIIRIGSETRDAIQGINKVDKAIGVASSRSRKAGKVMGAAWKAAGVGALAAGAAFVAVAGDAVAAAIEEEQSVGKLAKTLDNLGLAYADTGVEKFIDDMQFSQSVADNKLRPAFDRLIRSTEDVGEAQRALQIAQDISVAKGTDILDVANNLGKAYDGNAQALGRMGLGIDRATLKQGDMAKITAELIRLYGGQSAAEADTLGGAMAGVKIAADELIESFGQGLVGATGDSVEALQKQRDELHRLQPAAEDAGKVIHDTGSELLLLADDSKLAIDALLNGDWQAWSTFWTETDPTKVQEWRDQLHGLTAEANAAAAAVAALDGAAKSLAAAERIRKENLARRTAAWGADAAADSTWNASDVTARNYANASARQEKYAKRYAANLAAGMSSQQAADYARHHKTPDKWVKAQQAKADAAAKAAADASAAATARASRSTSQASALDLSYLDGPWSPTRSNRNRKIMERRADGRAAQRDARTGGRP